MHNFCPRPPAFEENINYQLVIESIGLSMYFNYALIGRVPKKTLVSLKPLVTLF